MGYLHKHVWNISITVYVMLLRQMILSLTLMQVLNGIYSGDGAGCIWHYLPTIHVNYIYRITVSCSEHITNC